MQDIRLNLEISILSLFVIILSLVLLLLQLLLPLLDSFIIIILLIGEFFTLVLVDAFPLETEW